jgi:hypothetical protein
MLIETDLLAEFIERASSAKTDWEAACAHCRSLPPDEFHDNQAEHTTVMRLHRELFEGRCADLYLALRVLMDSEGDKDFRVRRLL